MYEDGDPFPFSCPNCGHEIPETIGSLKEKAHFTCPRCTHNFWFHRETLADTIDKLKRAADDFRRSIRSGKQSA